VASSRSREAGYATAAAAVVAMALSMGVISVHLVAQQELINARNALERSRVEAELDGVLLLAAAQVIADGRPGRYRWTVAGDKGPIEILAEPEAVKLSLTEAAKLTDEDLAHLGATAPDALRARLRALAAGGRAPVSSLEGSALWRLCAPSLLSRYGRGKTLALSETVSPAVARADWRAGEEWRLRAVTQDGWTDDRVVRFTGEPQRPTGTIERRLVRDGARGEACGAFISEEASG